MERCPDVQCGAVMSAPMRGRNSGRLISTCPRCGFQRVSDPSAPAAAGQPARQVSLPREDASAPTSAPPRPTPKPPEFHRFRKPGPVAEKLAEFDALMGAKS